MRDVRERLLDIIEAIERIERYAAHGEDAFRRDDLIQTWIVFHLQIIGEASSKLGRDFHEMYPEVPWPRIVAMRNVLVHDYFGIDLNEVWAAVERELPDLKHEVEKILKDIERK